MSKNVEIAYKPHTFLAKRSQRGICGYYYLSLAIPIYAGDRITKIERISDVDHATVAEHIGMDVYQVTIKKNSPHFDGNDLSPTSLTLSFSHFTKKIKRGNGCKYLIIEVKIETSGQNGHGKKAIHTYDDASEPVG